MDAVVASQPNALLLRAFGAFTYTRYATAESFVVVCTSQVCTGSRHCNFNYSRILFGSRYMVFKRTTLVWYHALATNPNFVRLLK